MSLDLKYLRPPYYRTGTLLAKTWHDRPTREWYRSTGTIGGVSGYVGSYMQTQEACFSSVSFSWPICVAKER